MAGPDVPETQTVFPEGIDRALIGALSLHWAEHMLVLKYLLLK